MDEETHQNAVTNASRIARSCLIEAAWIVGERDFPMTCLIRLSGPPSGLRFAVQVMPASGSYFPRQLRKFPMARRASEMLTERAAHLIPSINQDWLHPGRLIVTHRFRHPPSSHDALMASQKNLP